MGISPTGLHRGIPPPVLLFAIWRSGSIPGYHGLNAWFAGNAPWCTDGTWRAQQSHHGWVYGFLRDGNTLAISEQSSNLRTKNSWRSSSANL